MTPRPTTERERLWWLVRALLLLLLLALHGPQLAQVWAALAGVVP